MLLLGLGIQLWLLPGPRHIREVVFDIHTLFFGVLMMVLGFQSMSFAVFSKIYAVREGWMPRDLRFDRFVCAVTLERCLVTGGSLFLLGVLLSLYLFDLWRSAAYGDLIPHATFRIAIPAFALTMTGSQIILSGFFASLLMTCGRGIRPDIVPLADDF